MIEDNGTNFLPVEAMLTVRQGQGLLAGLIRCKRCGHKLHVRYWGKAGSTPRYLCPGDYGNCGRYCIGFGGNAADQRIEAEILSVISPAGILASLKAVEELDKHNCAHQQALIRQLQQAEYEAQRAFTQYDQVDPNNRLVADTLEQRWNEKLKAAEEIKRRISELQGKPVILDEQERVALSQLGDNFSETWKNTGSDVTIKKKILRCLIKEIIVDIDEENNLLKFIIHWDGGSHTAIDIPRPLPATVAHKTSDEDADIIKKMAPRYDDTEIAKVLSKLGRKTGKGNNWNKNNVGTIRRSLGIKAAKINNQDTVFNLTEACRHCGVSNSTLMRLINEGILPSHQVVQFAPFEINRADLDSEPVAGIIKTLKRTGKLTIGGSVLATQAELAL